MPSNAGRAEVPGRHGRADAHARARRHQLPVLRVGVPGPPQHLTLVVLRQQRREGVRAAREDAREAVGMVGNQVQQLLGAAREGAGERTSTRAANSYSQSSIRLATPSGSGVLLPGMHATVSEQVPRSSSRMTWWDAPRSLNCNLVPISSRSSVASAGSGSRPRAQARSAARVSVYEVFRVVSMDRLRKHAKKGWSGVRHTRATVGGSARSAQSEGQDVSAGRPRGCVGDLEGIMNSGATTAFLPNFVVFPSLRGLHSSTVQHGVRNGGQGVRRSMRAPAGCVPRRALLCKDADTPLRSTAAARQLPPPHPPPPHEDPPPQDDPPPHDEWPPPQEW